MKRPSSRVPDVVDDADAEAVVAALSLGGRLAPPSTGSARTDPRSGDVTAARDSTVKVPSLLS